MIIHRYEAFSTNSIYLKFDYGAANSLRISDHAGYGYLSYRYNIIFGLKEPYTELVKKGYLKEYFPPEMKNTVIERIIAARELRIESYRDYNAIVEKRRNEVDRSKSFWRSCREIK